MKYTVEDCINDTEEHIFRVIENIDEVISNIFLRGTVHDDSKLREPELSIFVEYTPKLSTTTYGSEEYKEHLKGMQVALDHHYKVNSHHPEHYENGINGMSLMDIVEMLCDWKAATERHDDGDIYKSLEINAKRFGIDEQLLSILLNTLKELGW
jgi:hypothetical protein